MDSALSRMHCGNQGPFAFLDSVVIAYFTPLLFSFCHGGRMSSLPFQCAHSLNKHTEGDMIMMKRPGALFSKSLSKNPYSKYADL